MGRHFGAGMRILAYKQSICCRRYIFDKPNSASREGEGIPSRGYINSTKIQELQANSGGHQKNPGKDIHLKQHVGLFPVNKESITFRVC